MPKAILALAFITTAAVCGWLLNGAPLNVVGYLAVGSVVGPAFGVWVCIVAHREHAPIWVTGLVTLVVTGVMTVAWPITVLIVALYLHEPVETAR